MAENQQNQLPSEFQLKDLLALAKKEIFLSMNVHAIGTVQSFDAETQTASATINYQKSFLRKNSAGVYQQRQEDYPQLIECPVVCLGGGGGSLTFPIAAGDECLILFNDRDIDNWFQGSMTSPPATPRLHSFSDAIILVGLRSMNNVIADYDDDGVSLRFGDNKVKISQDKIELKVGTTLTLEVNSSGKWRVTNATGEFIAVLIDALTQILSGTAAGFPFILPPAYTTDLTKLTSFKV